jgi:hypothetical protein
MKLIRWKWYHMLQLWEAYSMHKCAYTLI